MLRVIRNSLLLFLIILLFTLTNLTVWLFVREPRRQRRTIQYTTRFWIQSTLWLLDITIQAEHRERLATGSGRLIIANHISSLDILVLYALHPATFVTSVEVGSDGLAGFLSKVGGAMFIERRSIKYLRREIAVVADLLEEGFDVVIFPEGTTTDGRSPLLPFKTAFFAAAAQKNAAIVPTAIRYLIVDDEPAAGENLEKIAYYGEMSFMTHLKHLLALKNLTIRVSVLEPVPAAVHSRDELGTTLREQIQAARDA